MFCPNCGNQMPDGGAFCPNCGARVEAEPVAPEASGASELPPEGADVEPQRPTPNIQLCADGVYRWFYCFDMLRNPTILYTTWNLEAIAFVITYVFITIGASIASGDNLFLMAWEMGKVFGLLLLVALVLGVIAYLIVAKSFGWRYLVIFEMDESGVIHRQMPEQFQVTEAIAWITLMTARSPTTAGAALLAASKSESVVRFANVRSVKVQRRRHTIKVNERLEHSQVYAAPEDFDFVLDYILRRVPKATKVSGK